MDFKAVYNQNKEGIIPMMNKKSLLAAIFLGLAFVFYLAFCIAFRINVGLSVMQWVVLIFLLVFGCGYFLGLLRPGSGKLSHNCLTVLLVGNVVISLVQDPAHFFEISSSLPTYQNWAYALAAIAGVLAFIVLVIVILADSLTTVGPLLKKIGSYLFLGAALIYLASGICYFFAGAMYWLFLGLFTAAFVYVGFYFAIPLTDNAAI